MTPAEWFGAVLQRPSEVPPDTVGDLELAPHQARAVAAIVACVDAFGGALLADAVGLGKTRVCLAAASRLQQKARRDGVRGAVALVVPARLQELWRERAHRAGFRDDQFVVVSHTRLSRGEIPDEPLSVVVVDEAHAFRNTGTNRYTALAQLAGDLPLVLATATPVANDLDDLRNLLELFLGDSDLRPWIGTDVRIAFADRGESLLRLLERVVVRRERWDDATMRRPRAKLQLLTYEPDPAEAWVWTNLAEMLRARDLELLRDDWPSGLFVEHALRLWESGPLALANSLAKLVDFHVRWLEAMRTGTTISRLGFRELFGHQPDQSVLPFMFEEVESASAPVDVAKVQADLDHLRRLSSRVRDAATAGGRERAIVELFQADPGKLLIFTSFREAARALFRTLVRELGPDARIGLVTGDESRATGLGTVAAIEVVQRFSPGAFDLDLAEHQSLEVLVATDCISEGVDLHDCGRIVLSDLPYTPLRVEQRIGRLLRPGSVHEEVIVHLPRPRNWNDSLGMRRRLSRKLHDAATAGAPYSNLEAGSAAVDNPLAVLTKRDAWIRALPTSPESAPKRARVQGRSEALWLVVRLSDDRTSEDLVVRCDARGVSSAWSELLPDLEELRHLVSEAMPTNDVHRSERHAFELVEKVVAELNAARLAPHAIGFDSAPYAAFRSIAKWSEQTAAPVDPDELRDRLLRPWPRGIERRIAGWIDNPARGAREYLDLPRHPASTRVRVEQIYVLHVTE